MKYKIFIFSILFLFSVLAKSQENDSLQTENTLKDGKFGVFAQIDLNQSFGFRFAFSSHFEVAALIGPLSFFPERRQSLYFIGINPRYYFLKSSLTPFIGLTVLLQVNRQRGFFADEISTAYSANYAFNFGLQHFITKKLAAFAQISTTTSGEVIYIESGIGLSFYF